MAESAKISNVHVVQKYGYHEHDGARHSKINLVALTKKKEANRFVEEYLDLSDSDDVPRIQKKRVSFDGLTVRPDLKRGPLPRGIVASTAEEAAQLRAAEALGKKRAGSKNATKVFRELTVAGMLVGLGHEASLHDLTPLENDGGAALPDGEHQVWFVYSDLGVRGKPIAALTSSEEATRFAQDFVWQAGCYEATVAVEGDSVYYDLDKEPLPVGVISDTAEHAAALHVIANVEEEEMPFLTVDGLLIGLGHSAVGEIAELEPAVA